MEGEKTNPYRLTCPKDKIVGFVEEIESKGFELYNAFNRGGMILLDIIFIGEDNENEKNLLNNLIDFQDTLLDIPSKD